MVQRGQQGRERLHLRLRCLREARPGRPNRAQPAHRRGRQGQEDHRSRFPRRQVLQGRHRRHHEAAEGHAAKPTTAARRPRRCAAAKAPATTTRPHRCRQAGRCRREAGHHAAATADAAKPRRRGRGQARHHGKAAPKRPGRRQPAAAAKAPRSRPRPRRAPKKAAPAAARRPRRRRPPPPRRDRARPSHPLGRACPARSSRESGARPARAGPQAGARASSMGPSIRFVGHEASGMPPAPSEWSPQPLGGMVVPQTPGLAAGGLTAAGAWESSAATSSGSHGRQRRAGTTARQTLPFLPAIASRRTRPSARRPTTSGITPPWLQHRGRAAGSPRCQQPSRAGGGIVAIGVLGQQRLVDHRHVPSARPAARPSATHRSSGALWTATGAEQGSNSATSAVRLLAALGSAAAGRRRPSHDSPLAGPRVPDQQHRVRSARSSARTCPAPRGRTRRSMRGPGRRHGQPVQLVHLLVRREGAAMPRAAKYSTVLSRLPSTGRPTVASGRPSATGNRSPPAPPGPP